MIIYGKEKEILKAQKRSLAAWINNTLGATLVDVENLIQRLSTGVILCKLAKCIQLKVDEVRGCYGKGEVKRRLLQSDDII
ncbi:growth arrest-specific protein 2 [Caerostris darwini]|uniref:Growth arrest-specific protein 2 n=1 Tax=Caerostris darwini TaxID=1538125 RepID=A0AAV4USX0_9ARAC|nr:growth arrest-specific protein 2 [Caerostris darwini]